MVNEQARDVTTALYESGAPFLRISGVHEKHPRWFRNVAAGDHRRGPWLSAVYQVLDAVVWGTVAPCIYIVKASDDGFRYVGMSKNKLKDRWRLSPGYDQTLKKKLPEK